MSKRLLVLLLVLPLAIAPPLGAQTLAELRACGVEPDSARAVLAVRATPRDSTQRLSSFFLEALADEVANHVTLPAPLELALFQPVRTAGARLPEQLYLGVSGIYEVILGRQGTVLTPRIVATSLSPAVDSAMLAAMARAVAEPGFGAMPGDVRGSALALRVSLTTLDSAHGAWVPLRTIATRRVPLEASVKPLGRALPEYPGALQTQGVQGDVLLEFVVGTDGRPMPGTLRVLDADAPELARAAAAAVERSRFQPARVRGCAIPMRVRQPFAFRLR